MPSTARGTRKDSCGSSTARCARAGFLLKDNGGSRDLAKNIGNPVAPLLYTISIMRCTPISIGQGAPPGLGATRGGGETAEEYLAAAGVASVKTHRLRHDPINAHFIARV